VRATWTTVKAMAMEARWCVESFNNHKKRLIFVYLSVIILALYCV
jgi:hypothetical protein